MFVGICVGCGAGFPNQSLPAGVRTRGCSPALSGVTPLCAVAPTHRLCYRQEERGRAAAYVPGGIARVGGCRETQAEEDPRARTQVVRMVVMFATMMGKKCMVNAARGQVQFSAGPEGLTSAGTEGGEVFV